MHTTSVFSWSLLEQVQPTSGLLWGTTPSQEKLLESLDFLAVLLQQCVLWILVDARLVFDVLGSICVVEDTR